MSVEDARASASKIQWEAADDPLETPEVNRFRRERRPLILQKADCSESLKI